MEQCRLCGFDPSNSDDDEVKSVYLSVGRFACDDAEVQQAYREELQVIAGRIQSGKSVDYDAQELDRLRVQKEMVESVPAMAVWGAVFRLFLPALIFLAILGLVNVLLKIALR